MSSCPTDLALAPCIFFFAWHAINVLTDSSASKPSTSQISHCLCITKRVEDCKMARIRDKLTPLPKNRGKKRSWLCIPNPCPRINFTASVSQQTDDLLRSLPNLFRQWRQTLPVTSLHGSLADLRAVGAGHLGSSHLLLAQAGPH